MPSAFPSRNFISIHISYQRIIAWVAINVKIYAPLNQYLFPKFKKIGTYCFTYFARFSVSITFETMTRLRVWWDTRPKQGHGKFPAYIIKFRSRCFVQCRMTLHLSHVSPVAAMQLSDRLITVRGKKYDADSNKTLVLTANNGIVVISYCGLAYLAGTPSDEFIAKLLIGEPPLFRGRIPSLGNGTFQNNRTIDQITHKIIYGLENWFRRSVQDKKQYFGISVCGWRTRKHYCEPVIFSMAKETNCGSFTYLDVPARHWWWNFGSHTNDLPRGYLCKSEFAAIASLPKFSTYVNENTFLNDRMKFFLSIIRRAADSTKMVGHDAISVMIPPINRLKIVYIQLDWLFKKKIQDQLFGPIPVTHTPWIIGSSSYIAPSILGGGQCVHHTDGYDIVLNSPPNLVGMLQMGSISRPPPPR